MSRTQVSERTVEAVELDMGWSLLTLRNLLGVSERTIYTWLNAARIKPACRKSVMFSSQDLDNFATFYVATKILRMTGRFYTEEVVPRSSVTPIPGLGHTERKVDHLFGLEIFYRQVFKKDLYQALRMETNLSELPPFTKNIIKRLEADYEYSRAS